MNLTTFAVVYVIGGLTFLPLLLAAVLVPAWFLLPQTGSKDTSAAKKVASPAANKKKDSKDAEVDGERDETGYSGSEGDGAASATFAVLREYHFPSAVAALNTRASASGGANNAATNASGAADVGAGDGTNPNGSESVYQSMYRSVFNRNAQQTGSVLEHGGDSAQPTDGPASRLRRKPIVNSSIFYIVLRHGHLMLYDSPAQLEVRHVISLAHHTISITDDDDGMLPDADLFIKRTAIVLTPIPGLLPNGHHAAPDAFSTHSAPKPFYLFSSTCIEKEDFYHALLSTRASPPVAQPVAPEDLIKLQSTLHSTSLTPETRAFNALVSRIFLALHRTAFLENLIRRKVETKIARVQKPSFIASLSVKSIDLGDSAPVLSQPRLKDINISGDLTLSFDLRYNGGVQLVIAAVAKLDLGSRFKTRFVDLVLATSLQRLSGKMLVRVKPSPSNRIWFCFESMPDMEIKVEPVVSTRQITYNFILRAIEERIRGVVGETLVKPNWDDVPFYNTRHQRVRGGIWSDEGSAGAMAAGGSGTSSADSATAKDKSMSMPDLVAAAESADHIGASSGSDTTATLPLSSGASVFREKAANLKRRSVASLPPQQSSTIPLSDEPSPQLPARPLRSPSFTSPTASAPSVAVNDVSGVAVRPEDDVPQPRTWRSRPAPQAASRKAAAQAMREMRDRTMPASERQQGASSGGDSGEEEGVEPDQGDSQEPSHTSPRDSVGVPSRTDSERSNASSNSAESSRQQPNQRKNILAATAAATTAARNWSWNAIANRTARGGQRQRMSRTSTAASQASVPQDQPMGRGQPLPPPGTPLPGPPRSLFTGFAGAVGAKGSIKRKPAPALPPRRAGTQASGVDSQNGSTSSLATPISENASNETLGQPHYDEDDLGTELVAEDEIEDEFGPWRENSGMEGYAETKRNGSTSKEESDVETPILEEQELAVAAQVANNQPRDTGPKGVADSPKKKKPPPLPARGRKDPLSSSSLAVPKSAPSPPSQEPTKPSPDALEGESATTDGGSSAASSVNTNAASHTSEDDGSETRRLGDGSGERGSHMALPVSEAQEKFLAGQRVEEADFEQDDPREPADPAQPSEEGSTTNAESSEETDYVGDSTSKPINGAPGLGTPEKHAVYVNADHDKLSAAHEAANASSEAALRERDAR